MDMEVIFCDLEDLRCYQASNRPRDKSAPTAKVPLPKLMPYCWQEAMNRFGSRQAGYPVLLNGKSVQRLLRIRFRLPVLWKWQEVSVVSMSRSGSNVQKLNQVSRINTEGCGAQGTGISFYQRR